MEPSRYGQPPSDNLVHTQSRGGIPMKTLATLTAASTMALAGVAAAQQPTPTPSTPPAQPATPTPPPANPQATDQAQRGPGMNRADFNSLTDAWIAAIQAGL